MKKIFTFCAAVLASVAMSATTIFSYTLTAAGTDGAIYDAEGGTAKCVKAMASGGSNEITIGDQTFYKFNSSSAWEFTLADEATFAEGDVIYITAACGTSNKSGKGVKLNGISVTGDFPASTANTISYTVVAGDAIDGQPTIRIERNDSDIKFGSISVDREGATPSTDPVEAAEISGETGCLVGGSIVLTCNASKATSYQWSMNGTAIEGATAKTYTFAPTAAGEYSFTCAASNEYNVAPAVAAAHVVTVVDPANVCGELIKAQHVNKNTATVTGLVGGTADKSTQDNGKLGSNGHYFGVKLTQGNFMAGDEVTIVASVLNGGNTATIYSDKGTTLLGSADFDTESLTATYLLEDNAEWIYVYRTTSACNPNIDYISVSRSCEASSNANIKNLTINGEAIEAVEGVYSYTVGASQDLAAVEVVYTLAHPRATATPASGFTIQVPTAGAAANTQVITVTAEDNTQAQYTVSVAKSAEASHDATLSALTVDGYTLDPVFASDVLYYTITKAYGAENPAASAIHAIPNDANANAIVENAINDVFSVVVTAEDGTTQLTYTITILEAPARKNLLQATFSNGVHGFILNGNIDVPYLATESEPTFVDATFWQADGEPTAEMVAGNLVVTGIDGQTDTYTITYVPLTPMEPNYEEITFDGVPSYVYSVYGWEAGKGLKFSKDVEEATNHRISEGKDRIYMALPAAQNITLTSGSGANRPVEVLVNGHIIEMSIKTPKSGETINFPLDPAAPNFIGFESKGNNGDAGFTKIQLEQPFPTAIEQTETDVKAIKTIRHGQLIIIRGEKQYNAQGQQL